MKIYMAALHSNGYRHTNRYLKLNEREKHVVDHLPFLLESYHYIHKDSFVNAIRDRGDKVFLDSGAFSAFTLGIEINLDRYCDYVKANQDILAEEDGIPIVSVLDGIGDAHLTYENQIAMQERGVTPLPCFHAGEDERYLEWYVENYDYITLGGMVGTSAQQLMIWLDRIWSKYLLDDAGKPLPPRGIGEIRVRGTLVCRGYLDPSLDREAFDADGYFCTGELGWVDADGYLTITGRLKDVIIRNGENITAKEIENTLSKMEGISEVAVIGVPDEILGQAVVVFIAPESGIQITEKEVLKYCSQNLESFAMPKTIEILEKLPKTPNGKIDKKQLKESIQTKP